ncbi:hypothetical protein BBAD15_g8384 [Beauveria bassiana D1-5]|uniref:Uncharacterized protein n=1 Tax=Beauveria bassiana D1-5 TaxID=1245745 RepID=A0A0A2VJJ2_BEABA|nr:hypothetical protein BBAD15_g8384 [Beauveria bassiana D1-5]
MPPTSEDEIPEDAEEWFDMVQEANEIESVPRSSFTFEPFGSRTRQAFMSCVITEVEGSSFKGYVSPKNMELAGSICRNLSGHWREYRAQINANASDLTFDQSAGPWSLVRMWQCLVVLHTKNSDNRQKSPDIEDDYSHIIKTGYAYKAESRSSGVTREPQSAQFVNLPLHTPEPTTEAPEYLENMTWIPPRLALKLTAATAAGNGANIVELMRALVDGYLCKRHGREFEDAPLAICEAKPFIRSEHISKTQRQETAEMASWIAHHGDSKNGLLQDSASGRKRRLMISQDRHEIYIIIGEYSDKYQDYIRDKIELKATADEPTTSHEYQSHRHQAAGSEATVKLARSIQDSYFLDDQPTQQQQQKRQKGQKRTDSTASSNTSVRTMSNRSRTKAANDAPQADEFLIMHQFGPFLTHKDDHMEILLRRIVAFMLELRGDESQRSTSQRSTSQRPTEKEILGRFPPPNEEFLAQDLSRSFPPRSEMKMHPSEKYRY